MAKNVRVDNALNTNAQPIKDQDGNASVLSLSITAVGIGTNNPSAKVEINDGDLLFKASAENPGKVLFQNAAGEQKGRIWSNPSAGSGLFFSSRDTAADLSISPSGNVGIGTTVPSAKLEINNGDLLFKASAEDPGKVLFQNAAGEQKGRIWSNPSAGSGLFFSSRDTAADLSISPSGNIGIGTAVPSAKLEINNGDLLFKAASDDPGDIVFQNASGVQKARIWSNPAPEAGLYLCGGDIALHLNISSSGNVGMVGNLWVGGSTSHFAGSLGVAGDLWVEGAGAHFKNIAVTGDINLLNGDCAEDFDICETDLAEPGTVMVLGEDGKLQQSQQAYDKRVAGVISGAGNYKPGIVLDKQETGNTRKPVALLGKVFCKVDASFGAIEIGDLLTTSKTPGHAMKVIDHQKALGTILGKALKPLREGQGLIPILIALQ